MILQLAPDYYNTSIYRSLFVALAHRGVESRVYVADNVRKREQADHDADQSQICVASKTFSPLERMMYFPKQRYIMHEIEQNIAMQDVSLIHAHTLFSSGYCAYRLWKKYHIPYIVAVRNTDVNVFFRYMKHLVPIGWKILSHAERVIFLSPAYKQAVLTKHIPPRLRAAIEAKTEVIPNGIQPVYLSDVPAHVQDDQCLRLIYVGKIMRLKNIDTVIRVGDQLVAGGHKVSLTIVGKIVEPHYAEMMAARPYIIYIPPTDAEGVRAILRQNDILLMPSYAETFGLVYAEAMSQGLPVIYTRGQGFDGWFTDGEIGYAVTAYDAREIAKRVIDIHSAYPTLSPRCIQAAGQFNWERIADRYVTIYKETNKQIK